jgi:hypothetical protein
MRLSLAHFAPVAYTAPYLVHNNQYIFQTISIGGEQHTTDMKPTSADAVVLRKVT